MAGSANQMRRPLLFGVLTAAHLALTVQPPALVFGSGMSRFDTGGQPGWFETACGRLLTALGFPLLTLVEGRMGRRFPGLWGYVPFVANSALWARPPRDPRSRAESPNEAADMIR